MTISIVTRDPLPAATSVSRTSSARVSLSSNDLARPVLRSSIQAWLSGAHVVVSGSPVDGRSTVVANGLGGYDLTLVPVEALPSDDTVTVRVTADDTVSSSPVDETWSFTTIEDLGPRINHAVSTPAPGSNPATTPATITVFVSDALTEDIDFTLVDVNVEYAPPPPIGAPPAPANQLYVTPRTGTASVTYGDTAVVGTGTLFTSEFAAPDLIRFDGDENSYEIASVTDNLNMTLTTPYSGVTGAGKTVSLGPSLRGLEGRRIQAPGQWRTIVSVQGPGLATYDGAQLSGTNVNVDVYRNAGLDVVVDGQMIVQTGQPLLWGAVVTTPAGGAQVVMTPTTSWSDGARVPVFVRATDADGDVSELSYDFLVGQAQGPVVSNISPAPGVRGLPIGPGVSSDLAFRVTSADGVALASVNVLVDNAAAITAGVGVGVYSTSTLTPVAGGYDVVIKRSTAYADGRIVHVDVSCTDTSARPGERRVWSVQYGTAVGAQAATAGGGEIPSDNVVRVVAYDLSDSSFCRPAELRHNGYAADGYWYDNGSRTEDVATWFTQLGQFPAGGQFVVTADGGWALLPTLAAVPWVQCAQFVGSGWNMAGNAASPLLDGDFDPSSPVLALASALGVVTVDFTTDRARLYTSAGRALSAWRINQRTLNQTASTVDTGVVIDASAVQRVALSGGVLVAAQAAALTVVQGDVSRSQAYSTTWVRARVSGTEFALAYNDGGQGAVEVWTVGGFFAAAGMTELYDDMSTPALPAATVSDIDLVGNALFIATPTSLEVVDRAGAGVTSLSQATLGLAGAGSVTALSACRDAAADYGYLYAGADSPGRVVRFRLHWPAAAARSVVVSDGVAVASVSAAGTVTDSGVVYLRSAMDIAP